MSVGVQVCMCLWLCVFYNGAPGSGPGLLLCHTRLPHTHTDRRGASFVIVIHRRVVLKNDF